MPFFALLKRSKIAREQSADRDGGGRSSKRTKRGVLRELFRWNTGARKPERQSDVEALPPLLEVVVSSDDGSEQRPSVPFTAIGLKPASQKKTLTDDDFHKLFSGAPQFSLLKPPDALRPPQPRVTFPWDTDPRIHDLTDCARFPHPVFSLSTTQPYPPPTDDAASGEGRQSGAQTGYDIGVVEVPSAISAQGLELGTVGYEYLMMLPFADMLEELVDEEAGSSDDDGEVGGRTAMWRRRRLLREGPEGGKRIGLRSIETNVIATRLQELGHLYHGSEDRDSTRAPLDLLKEQSSVQLYAQLFTRILYPPDRVHNADADDPYSLKVQIEALVKALSAARIWHDFSIVETRLRLGELLFGDPTLSVAGAGAERRWLLLQILLSCELLVRLDAVAGSSGQELARSTLEGLVGFYGVGRGKIEWDIMLARRWLENVRLAIGGAIEAGNHNRNDSNSNPAISPSLATTQDPTAKKKGTSWSWFSQNPSQTPAAALQPPTDTDPDDIPIMATWRNPQRQISGLLYFAETLGWPGVDTLRQELEVRTREGLGVPISLGADKNAEEHTTTTTIHTPSWPLDTYLTSLILPGPSLSHHLMASLLPSPFPPTATNIGLIHLGKSYWNKNSIVGKVLAGVSGAKEVGGWIAGVELNIEGAEEGWIAAGPEEQSREIPPSSTTTTDLAPSARELRIPPPPPPQPQMQNITLTLTPSTATLTLPPFPALPLLHNPTFLTAFPCVLPPHPLSTHIPYSFTPLNPYPPPPPHAARNHILILDARRGAGTGAEVLARAWCAAVGLAVVLVAREARGACLACAVREGWVVGGGESGEGGVVVVWVARLAPVPEETIATKTAKLPLWQKMENKVAISRVKKAKERLQYRMMKGSNEEVDGEEVRGEGFVDQEIWKLREELGAYATTYGVYDSHPPHPNHHQTWLSKNLRCTVCTENCGICGVACCKWNQAKNTEREAYLASEEMVTATRTIQRIEIYLRTGFDLPTFLRCTECRILVCPSCCGQCPVVMCKDLKCNKCVEDPWQRCEYHDETDE